MIEVELSTLKLEIPNSRVVFDFSFVDMFLLRWDFHVEIISYLTEALVNKDLIPN